MLSYYGSKIGVILDSIIAIRSENSQFRYNRIKLWMNNIIKERPDYYCNADKIFSGTPNSQDNL